MTMISWYFHNGLPYKGDWKVKSCRSGRHGLCGTQGRVLTWFYLSATWNLDTVIPYGHYYKGTIQNPLPHGQGTVLYSNDCSDEGEWKLGKKEHGCAMSLLSKEVSTVDHVWWGQIWQRKASSAGTASYIPFQMTCAVSRRLSSIAISWTSKAQWFITILFILLFKWLHVEKRLLQRPTNVVVESWNWPMVSATWIPIRW